MAVFQGDGEDDLSPVWGIVVGLLLAVPFWAVVLWAVR